MLTLVYAGSQMWATFIYSIIYDMYVYVCVMYMDVTVCLTYVEVKGEQFVLSMIFIVSGWFCEQRAQVAARKP